VDECVLDMMCCIGGYLFWICRVLWLSICRLMLMLDMTHCMA